MGHEVYNDFAIGFLPEKCFKYGITYKAGTSRFKSDCSN